MSAEPHTSDTEATAVAEHDEHGHGPKPVEDRFKPQEIDGFSDEDRVAGAAIGKMLSIFFLYTVIAMTISAVWTYLQLK